MVYLFLITILLLLLYYIIITIITIITRKFPSCWKQAFTILIHKKGSSMEPSNFRPITLQPVFAKIHSLLIQSRIYNFLENQFIESNIQKGS